MRALKLVIVAATILTPVAASAMTGQERVDAAKSLNWVRDGTYKPPASNSSIAIPKGYIAVFGGDARRLVTLFDPPAAPQLEAIVVTSDFEDEVRFESFNEGYVPLDDWNDVDATALLREISDNTEEANATRRREGVPELHVIGWIQPPTLDRRTNTVYWALDAFGANGNVANSIALRLARNGFEKLTWVTDRLKYRPVGGQLDVMLSAHSFDPGYRYADHESGDKMALYGIAGLIAAVTGAKAVKVAAGAGLLMLLKKLGVFIFAAIAAASYRLKNLFWRRPSPADRVEPEV